MSTLPDVTQLLRKMQRGDAAAHDEIFPLVYEELRCLAHGRLRRGRRHTINTTGLVHSAYLRLFDRCSNEWKDRSHFFAVATRVMRQILVDHFRRKSAQKRGGGKGVVTLREDDIPADMRGDVLLAIDEALTRLATLNPRLAEVVEYKFFGGMTQEEIADTMSLSARTVRSDWRKAKAWLAHELSEEFQ